MMLVAGAPDCGQRCNKYSKLCLEVLNPFFVIVVDNLIYAHSQSQLVHPFEPMAKYSFHDDYSEGAHPMVLQALLDSNMVQQPGYGTDDYCEDARAAIRKLLGGIDDAAIYFIPGGTGANLVSIASFLRPHEAVITVDRGHIVGKEGGAIEATGHKIISVPGGKDGKLTSALIQSAYEESILFPWQPKMKMAFISNSTEIGTVYTKSELADVAATCKKLGMWLLLDGARLGHALTCSKNDMTLQDIYHFTDIFWLGATKNGALLGEAIVIKDPTFAADFRYHMKQRGMLLAKGRTLGIQFSALLKNNLFFDLACHANTTAAEISSALVKLKYELWAETETNQVFAIFPGALVTELNKSYEFFLWEPLPDGNCVVRFVTSWATEQAQVDKFCDVVKQWTEMARSKA